MDTVKKIKIKTQSVFFVSVLTPKCCTQYFRVESLLVFTNLWRVVGRTSVGGVDVHHGALSDLHLQLLEPGA